MLRGVSPGRRKKKVRKWESRLSSCLMDRKYSIPDTRKLSGLAKKERYYAKSIPQNFYLFELGDLTDF